MENYFSLEEKAGGLYTFTLKNNLYSYEMIVDCITFLLACPIRYLCVALSEDKHR